MGLMAILQLVKVVGFLAVFYLRFLDSVYEILINEKQLAMVLIATSKFA